MRKIAVIAASIALLPVPALAQVPSVCLYPYTGSYIDQLASNLCRNQVIMQELERQQLLEQQQRVPPPPARTSRDISDLERGPITTRKDKINLRSGNSTTSAVIGNLPAGTMLYVADAVQSKDGDGSIWRWVRVDSGALKGKYGYVREDLIRQ